MPSFPTSTRAGTEARRAERTTGGSAGPGPGAAKAPSVWKMLPDVWELLKPRRRVLAGGFALMAINRVSGLVLPYSSKYLFDNVFIKHEVRVLLPLVLAVLAATLIQGLTSYSL